MKKCSILVLFFFVFFSCEKNGEDAVLGTSIWAPNIYAELGDKSTILHLSDPRPYTDYAGPGPENPDYFELLISEDLENFELFRRLDNFTERLEIDALVNGQNYYFKVMAYRTGFDSVRSNTSMTIPSEIPKLEPYALGTNFSVQGLSLSADLIHMAFYSPNYLNGATSSDLLVLDTSSGEVTSLGYFSYAANWDSNTNRLAYISTILLGNTLYGDNVQIYDAETQETNTLLLVDYTKYYVDLPMFRPDMDALSYFSSKDNSELFINDLWSIDLQTKEESKLSDFEAMSFYATTYDWASSGKAIYVAGSLGMEEYTENIFNYNIDSKQLAPVVESQWRDSRPSLSPDATKLAFLSNRSGFSNQDIWVYDLNTSTYSRLTGDGQQRRFFSTTSNVTWLDNDHLLITINTNGTTNPSAYTIEVP